MTAELESTLDKEDLKAVHAIENKWFVSAVLVHSEIIDYKAEIAKSIGSLNKKANTRVTLAGGFSQLGVPLALIEIDGSYQYAVVLGEPRPVYSENVTESILKSYNVIEKYGIYNFDSISNVINSVPPHSNYN